jgi:hypothetical protein
MSYASRERVLLYVAKGQAQKATFLSLIYNLVTE